MEFYNGESIVSLEGSASTQSGFSFTHAGFVVAAQSVAALTLEAREDTAWIFGDRTLKILKEDVGRVQRIELKFDGSSGEPSLYTRMLVKEGAIEQGCEAIIEAFMQKMDAIIRGAGKMQAMLAKEKESPSAKPLTLADHLKGRIHEPA